MPTNSICFLAEGILFPIFTEQGTAPDVTAQHVTEKQAAFFWYPPCKNAMISKGKLLLITADVKSERI